MVLKKLWFVTTGLANVGGQFLKSFCADCIEIKSVDTIMRLVFLLF